MNKTIDLSSTNIPTIAVETNYEKFKIMSSNRIVDRNHVSRLKKEMQQNPLLLSTSPILVNENFFVIDGQHRLKAASELGHPIYYIIAEGSGIDETRALNATQRKWTMLDFAKSYAASGYKDYEQFLALNSKFPSISPSILRMYLTGMGKEGNIESDFRLGNFVIDDIKESLESIEKLQQIVDTTDMRISTPMARALRQVFQNHDFDFDTFITKLKNEGAQERFVMHHNVRSCLRSIEEVYNFHNKIQTRLY